MVWMSSQYGVEDISKFQFDTTSGSHEECLQRWLIDSNLVFMNGRKILHKQGWPFCLQMLFDIHTLMSSLACPFMTVSTLIWLSSYLLDILKMQFFSTHCCALLDRTLPSIRLVIIISNCTQDILCLDIYKRTVLFRCSFAICGGCSYLADAMNVVSVTI